VCGSAKFSEVATAYEVLAIAPPLCVCMHHARSLHSYMNHAPQRRSCRTLKNAGSSTSRCLQLRR